MSAAAAARRPLPHEARGAEVVAVDASPRMIATLARSESWAVRERQYPATGDVDGDVVLRDAVTGKELDPRATSLAWPSAPRARPSPARMTPAKYGTC